MYGSTSIDRNQVHDETDPAPSNSREQDSSATSSLKIISYGTFLALIVLLGLSNLTSFRRDNQIIGFNSLSSSSITYSTLSVEEQIELFEEFKIKYGVKYTSEEEEAERFSIFIENLNQIDALNDLDNGAQYGITRFADYSAEEIKKVKGYKVEEEIAEFEAIAAANDAFDTYNDHLIGYKEYSSLMCGACTRYPEMADYLSVDDVPDSFDWRDYDAVTTMRNQYICGDCWSFAVTDAIATQQYLYGEDLESLSAEQLTSCDTYCWGCDGGWYVGAFRYVFGENLCSDKGYPFMSRDGVTQLCRLDIVGGSNSNSQILGWSRVDVSDQEAEMKIALMRNGPMPVSIDATSMEFYTSGIDMATTCTTTDLDHAVLLVGWGVEDGVEYWIVKNSWGTIWGEEGYWKVIYGVNACGIAEYPIVTF